MYPFWRPHGYQNPAEWEMNVDRPDRPNSLRLTVGPARDRYEAAWSSNWSPDESDIRTHHLPERYWYPQINHMSHLVFTNEILSPLYGIGWVELIPPSPVSVRGLGEPFCNLVIPAETSQGNAREKGDGLLSFSGFSGNWTGRFRFAGAVIERVA